MRAVRDQPQTWNPSAWKCARGDAADAPQAEDGHGRVRTAANAQWSPALLLLLACVHEIAQPLQRPRNRQSCHVARHRLVDHARDAQVWPLAHDLHQVVDSGAHRTQKAKVGQAVDQRGVYLPGQHRVDVAGVAERIRKAQHESGASVRSAGSQRGAL